MNRNHRKLFALIFLSGLFLSPALWAQNSAPKRSTHSEVRLVSEKTGLVPGTRLTIGLLQKLDRGWHSYWQNAGDSGLETKIKWDLPDGFQASSIKWPMPHKISTPPLMSYGYKKEVLLLTEIKLPKKLDPGRTYNIKAQVKWLECADVCLPGKADLSLELKVDQNAGENKAYAGKFRGARALLPRSLHKSAISVQRHKENLRIIVGLNGDKKLTPAPYFFPANGRLIQHAAKQSVQRSQTGLQLDIKLAPDAPQLERLQGILVTGLQKEKRGTRPAYTIDVALPPSAVNSQGAGALTLLSAILFSLLGGLILNLMPCVLPVLSLKVMNLIGHADEKASVRFFSTGLYTAGILFSFWLLAGLLFAFRAGGEALGWGFQLQSPIFVAFLALFLLIFALNQLGVFEFNVPGFASNSPMNRSGGAFSAFGSGILTVVVATPCTAPFMGSAMGFAMTQPIYIAFLVFTSLGLGLAAPFLLLAGLPRLLRFIPKPGPWMDTLKQFMGFLLLATIVWLLWLLGRLAGGDALGAALGTHLIVALALWILGRWATPNSSGLGRAFARISATLLIFLAGYAAYLSASAPPPPAIQGGQEKTSGMNSERIPWQKWSQAKVDSLQKAGKPVFIDFTADWCISCKVNERVAFHNSGVVKAFRNSKVTPLIADWTHYDPTITRALESYGRSGLPFYVLYGCDGSPPKFLPEILTPGIMREALEDVCK